MEDPKNKDEGKDTPEKVEDKKNEDIKEEEKDDTFG